MPLKRIAIFAATLWEWRAVQSAFPSGDARRLAGLSIIVQAIGDREYWIVRTGVGPEKAKRSAAQVLGHQSFHLMVSTGFACALIATDVGTLLVGRDVVQRGQYKAEASQPIAVPGDEREQILKFVQTMVPPEHIGPFLSTDRVISHAWEKRQVAEGTRAIGLDMESAALAVEAQRAQVPFVIIRTASDLLDEDLPLDFNLFLRPTGWLKGIGSVVAAPSCLLGLGRLRRQSLLAAEALTVFFRQYAAVMAAQQRKQEHSPT